MITATVLALTLDVCSSCTLVDAEARLCEVHAAEQKSVVAEARKQLKAKDEGERVAALDALAALTRAHTNAPSEVVVDVIASALADESYAVRTHAATLLARPQHAERVLNALTRALGKAEEEHERLRKEKDELSRKLGDPKLASKKRKETDDRLFACKQAGATVFAWRAAILGQLAQLPDDRAVAAICAQVPRELVVGGNEALVRLGSRGAMNAFLESLRKWDREIAGLRAILEAEKQDPKRAGDQPTALGMSWSELALTEAQLAGRIVVLDVSKCFLEKGLPPPASASSEYDAWRRWVEEHSALFPEHLPGIPPVAWE